MSCLNPSVFDTDEDGNLTIRDNPSNCGCVNWNDDAGPLFPARCTPSPVCLIDSAGVRFLVWPELDCNCFPVNAGTPVITNTRGDVFTPAGIPATWHTCSDGAATLEYNGDSGTGTVDLDSDTLLFRGGAGILVPIDGSGHVMPTLRTSGTWGAGALPFAGASTGGAPTYIDSAGQVRTVPEHTSLTATATDATDNAATFTASGFSISADLLSVTVNNPSGFRALRALVFFSATILIDLVSSSTVLQGAGSISMRLEDSGTVFPWFTDVLGTGAAGSKYLTSASGPGIQHSLSSGQALVRSIVAGGSVTYGSSGARSGTVVDGLTTVSVKYFAKQFTLHATTV